jgi:hypothetical protein
MQELKRVMEVSAKEALLEVHMHHFLCLFPFTIIHTRTAPNLIISIIIADLLQRKEDIYDGDEKYPERHASSKRKHVSGWNTPLQSSSAPSSLLGGGDGNLIDDDVRHTKMPRTDMNDSSTSTLMSSHSHDTAGIDTSNTNSSSIAMRSLSTTTIPADNSSDDILTTGVTSSNKATSSSTLNMNGSGVPHGHTIGSTREPMITGIDEAPIAPSVWRCSTCFIANEIQMDTCRMCQTRRSKCHATSSLSCSGSRLDRSSSSMYKYEKPMIRQHPLSLDEMNNAELELAEFRRVGIPRHNQITTSIWRHLMIPNGEPLTEEDVFPTGGNSFVVDSSLSRPAVLDSIFGSTSSSSSSSPNNNNSSGALFTSWSASRYSNTTTSGNFIAPRDRTGSPTGAEAAAIAAAAAVGLASNFTPATTPTSSSSSIVGHTDAPLSASMIRSLSSTSDVSAISSDSGALRDVYTQQGGGGFIARTSSSSSAYSHGSHEYTPADFQPDDQYDSHDMSGSPSRHLTIDDTLPHEEWTCSTCTFVNEPACTKCAMCNYTRSLPSSSTSIPLQQRQSSLSMLASSVAPLSSTTSYTLPNLAIPPHDIPPIPSLPTSLTSSTTLPMPPSLSCDEWTCSRCRTSHICLACILFIILIHCLV